MKMQNSIPTSAAAILAILLVGCSGGNGNVGSVKGTSGDFVVLQTLPPNNGKLFLNEGVQIDLSNVVNLASADLNTVSFTVLDLNDNPINEQPAGQFVVERSAGDAAAGRRLVFLPNFPTNDTFDNGGFRPGRKYLVQLVGGDVRNRTVLTDVNGRPLARPVSFEFRTAEGSTPSQLFSDTRGGGPRRAGFEIVPSPTSEGVIINQSSQARVEIRLLFDQPLNPASTNVPVAISADPLQRNDSNRGRIFLEYTDTANGPGIWIPATVDLELNTRAGSAVVLRPIGVLPNNAEVRVIVENTIEDMSGESNVSDAAYNRIFATFRTREEFAPQYDAVVERFDGDNVVDEDAPFLQPRALLSNGMLSASFDFDGRDSRLVYRPNDRSVELNTNFATITPVGSSPINVAGGVFDFREVEIPDGVFVQGTGTNPLVFLVSGDFTVNGRLSVDGGKGAQVDSLNSANIATPGGVGVCGGGNGGRGSPITTDRSLSGESGFGANQRPGGGGEGGRLSCTIDCNLASGGGGGSLGTQGDPFYPPNTTLTWPQLGGTGGAGCVNRTLRGGAAGAVPFADSRPENNFWGSGVDNNVARQIRILGEIATPTGGAGGGGGGDRAPRCNVGDPSFVSDNKGGGGGAGAGVLIVKALGKIKIGRRGSITATGGNGGGGEPQGGNSQGGGGGGGSGGMVILMSAEGIEIEVHGDETRTPNPASTYGELDYDFAIAADGGVGTQGRFGGAGIEDKYRPAIGTPGWNARPAGGFGGLGIVQLMVPPGDDSDGTGNSLDDHITFLYVDATGTRVEVAPTRKKALLAWRGWPDATGQLKDEYDDPVILPNFGKGEGDIRPSPILLPSPFGRLSRARSFWIDMGAVDRQRSEERPTRNTPRVVMVGPGEPAPGPDFEFLGTSTRSSDIGYIRYGSTGQASFPRIEIDGRSEFEIGALKTDGDFLGQPAYRVDLVSGQRLGSIDDRYTSYRLQFSDGNRVFGDLPILGHRGQSVYLEPIAALPTAATLVRVVGRFVDVRAEGRPGLGSTFEGSSGTTPLANVRIGFAFHVDPRMGDDGRYPDPNHPDTQNQRFAFDLTHPSFRDYIDGTGVGSYSTPHRPTFVQYDVLFNTRFDPTAPNNDNGRRLTSEKPSIGIEELRLPYRF